MAKYLVLIYADESTYADMTPELWGQMMVAHNAFADAVDPGSAAISRASLGNVAPRSAGARIVPTSETRCLGAR